MARKPTPRIVEAVGTISLKTPGGSGSVTLGRLIEAAMSQAVLDCYAEGISDAKVHHARMLEARDRVKAEFYAKMVATPPTE